MGTHAVWKRWPRALGAVALLGLALGCAARQENAAAPPAPGAPLHRYKVTAATASFYKLGPQQPGGPDLGLKQGTRLALVKRAFGYSQVQLEDGSAGFVGTEDIAPLTPEEIAAEQSPPPGAALAANNATAATTPGKPRRRNNPRLAAPPPLPPGEEPTLPSAGPTPRAGPTPIFRY